MRRILGKRPTPAMVVGLLALFVALGGTSVALTKNEKKQIRKIAKSVALTKKKKKQIRNIANKRIDAKGPGLSVNHASTANSANKATTADSANHATTANSANHATNAASANHATTANSANHATNATNAANVGGLSPLRWSTGGLVAGSRTLGQHEGLEFRLNCGGGSARLQVRTTSGFGGWWDTSSPGTGVFLTSTYQTVETTTGDAFRNFIANGAGQAVTGSFVLQEDGQCASFGVAMG